MTDDFRNNQERTGTMVTQSGVRFDFRNPRPEDIRLHDVGHALGNYCRYGGHVPWHYSVAEHSVHVAVWVLALGGSFDEAKWGLTHDTEETWFGDVIGPLKQLPEMSGYKELTKRFVRQALVPRFELVPDFEPALVKQVDTMMLEVELAALRNIVNDEVQQKAYYRLMPFRTTSLVLTENPDELFLRYKPHVPVTHFHLVRVSETSVVSVREVVLYGHHVPDPSPEAPPPLGMSASRATEVWLQMAKAFGLRDEA